MRAHGGAAPTGEPVCLPRRFLKSASRVCLFCVFQEHDAFRRSRHTRAGIPPFAIERHAAQHGPGGQDSRAVPARSACRCRRPATGGSRTPAALLRRHGTASSLPLCRQRVGSRVFPCPLHTVNQQEAPVSPPGGPPVLLEDRQDSPDRPAGGKGGPAGRLLLHAAAALPSQGLARPGNGNREGADPCPAFCCTAAAGHSASAGESKRCPVDEFLEDPVMWMCLWQSSGEIAEARKRINEGEGGTPPPP